MERNEVGTLAARFKRAISESKINALGRAVRFSYRERIITPYRLVVSLLVGLSTGRVETLADIQRCFNAHFGTAVAYKPFHNQLAKARFADLMRELTDRLLRQWVVRVLGSTSGGAFSEFRRILIQDGSSFALKETLREVFSGRFTQISPAAVELHVSLDLLNESLSGVSLTADTASGRAELPPANTLSGALLLADRGYYCLHYLRDLISAQASFLIRATGHINPLVLAAYGPNGEPLRGCTHKWLKEIKRLPKRQAADLDVCWQVDGQALQCRLLLTWNPQTREYQYLITNLPRERYSPADVVRAYRLRWQVELLFKEWKSYANLHAFDTGIPCIAEGLIWAAIAAATLKRFVAHSTQVLMGVEISTRKVAMCARHVLLPIFQALIAGKAAALLGALSDALEYLARNAQGAHPKRVRQSGRLQFGLVPVLEMA